MAYFKLIPDDKVVLKKLAAIAIIAANTPKLRTAACMSALPC